MAAHYCLQTPDLRTHFSVPITLCCCCCLWMVLHRSCLIFPGCHSRPADDTDAKLNRRLKAVVEGSRMWKEMQVISNRIKPACHLLCIKMSISGPIFILETKLRETRRPFFIKKKQIYYQCTCPASFIYFNSGIPSWLPCIKARDTTGLSLDEILLQKLLAPYTMAL